jgi:hypothetical protein
MHGVQHMDVKDVNMASGLQPVLGSDGIQQWVSFNTHLASDEEGSIRVSCPPGFKQEQSSIDMSLGLHAYDLVTNQGKGSGPDRSGDKAKRERSSPYK